ncbi:MAG TPA: response regulator [Anaeromyxobacter sp.]
MASHARILLVEDDTALRSALAELLEERGFEVACACDGLEALEALWGRPAPSVILLDLVMPVMDGWAFRAEQRRHPRLAAIPTVVLSATLYPDRRALDGFPPAAALSKPFDLDRLVATVHRLCAA